MNKKIVRAWIKHYGTDSFRHWLVQYRANDAMVDPAYFIESVIENGYEGVMQQSEFDIWSEMNDLVADALEYGEIVEMHREIREISKELRKEENENSNDKCANN